MEREKKKVSTEQVVVRDNMHELLFGACLVGAFVTWTAGALAIFEIEIEGHNGWASALPTWRQPTCLCGRKPLTGYHVALAFVLISVSLTGVVTGSVLWGNEVWHNLCSSLSVFVWIMLTEDSFWFSMNYKYWQALREGKAVDHFGSLQSRLLMYAILAAISSGLWVLSYGSNERRWCDGAESCGYLVIVLALGQAYTRAAIAPLYRVIDSHLHGVQVSGKWVTIERCALLTWSTCFLIAGCVAADATMQWSL